VGGHEVVSEYEVVGGHEVVGGYEVVGVHEVVGGCRMVWVGGGVHMVLVGQHGMQQA